MASTEVAVVGAGIVGLAAADALVELGADVRCLEAAAPGSGQSAGLARSFRHAHEEERLVHLAVEARAGWRRWEERFRRRLLGKEGALLTGPDLHAHASRLAGAGVEFRVVEARERAAVLPILAPDAPPALFDAEAGSLRARRAVELLADALGPRLVSTEAIGIRPDGDRALVETTDGFLRARRVVVCAGRRTRELAASAGIDVPVETSCHARVAFRVRAEAAGRALACWTDRSGLFGELVYATPLGATGLYAVGIGAAGSANEPLPPGSSSLPAGSTMTEAVDRVRRYVERALPGLEPQPDSVRLCYVSRLPWGGDAFAVWQSGPVTAFAGHNVFKFAPELGRLIAEAVAGKTSSLLAPPVEVV